MLAEFSLVRFQVQTGKKGKPPLMVLPNLPLPSHQMEALAVAQYRCRQMEEEADALSAAQTDHPLLGWPPQPRLGLIQAAPPWCLPAPPAPGFDFGLPAPLPLGFRGALPPYSCPSGKKRNPGAAGKNTPCLRVNDTLPPWRRRRRFF